MPAAAHVAAPASGGSSGDGAESEAARREREDKLVTAAQACPYLRRCLRRLRCCVGKRQQEPQFRLLCPVLPVLSGGVAAVRGLVLVEDLSCCELLPADACTLGPATWNATGSPRSVYVNA